MTRLFRCCLVLLWGAAGMLALVGTAAAQGSFPNRTVTIVVPYAAGGGTDLVARTLALALQKHWGQTVVVDNLAGADGIIGTQKVLRAPADGYTILLQLNTMLLWKLTDTNSRDLVGDLRFISLIHVVGHATSHFEAVQVELQFTLRRQYGEGQRGRDLQRVAVGRRVGHEFGADLRGAAGPVLDHHGGVERAADMVRHQAAHDVGRAARWKGNDHLHRPRRPTVLGQCGLCAKACGLQRRDRGQRLKTSSGNHACLLGQRHQAAWL